jgi:glycosyltransferase involved in cell wall biosynthesis
MPARRTGTERYSLELIRHLLALGGRNRWRFYCQSTPAPGLFISPDSALEMAGDRRDRSGSCVVAPLGSLLPPASDYEMEPAADVTWRVLPVPRLWTHLGLSWEMMTHPPDVLFVPAHVLPAWRPRRSVVTVHDLGYRHCPEAHPRRQRLYLEWSTRWNAHVAARILADSQATRDDLMAAYDVPAERIVVVYPGRDESLQRVYDPGLLAAVQARYGLRSPYILYVGTLQPRKNLVRLIQAFARLLAQGDGVPEGLTLVLAGSPGWLSAPILAEPRRLGIEARVRFPGYVADADLPAILSGALAFAFPSLYEGFGFPVLEAQTCGVPVLTSSVTSLPEVAGDAAWLVDPSDVDAIADGLRRLIADADLRARLVALGYANSERFSWPRAARETMAVLEQVGGER